MYTMKEVCEKTGLSYETLKYYCNQKLIPGVQRDKNNRRVFNDDQVGWIMGLLCLKNCGMGIQEMKGYLELLAQGEDNVPQLKAILSRKREELERNMEQIKASIDFIDWKQKFYDDVRAGKLTFEDVKSFRPNK